MKTFVLTCFAILILGVIYLATNIEEAYKVIPIQEDTMKIAPFSDWREFVSQTGKFKVMLPATPQYAKDAVEIRGSDKKRLYEMYVSEKLDGPTFLVSLITYPQDVSLADTSEVLRSTVDEMMATKAGNRLEDFKEGRYQDYPSADFRFTNGDYLVNGRTFIVDQTVYLLTYIAQETNFTIGDYEHFIDSFRLGNEEPSKT